MLVRPWKPGEPRSLSLQFLYLSGRIWGSPVLYQSNFRAELSLLYEQWTIRNERVRSLTSKQKVKKIQTFPKNKKVKTAALSP